jgi:alanyl-tRNA synthetase
MTGDDIRREFLDYFVREGHQAVRSSSLVPQDDPTLLFTNAGMVQFKRTFLGEEKRSYVRATTSQKCVRAGGKHNDLENVGYTARHHTFFEMLGNFSFGDYFKEKAIAYAWDLLTAVYRLPEDKLWVSVFLDDDEAHDIWARQIGVPEDRIVRFGEKDNFWAMGDTGPCGPCSEILIDRGEAFGCGRPECRVGCECDRYLEIWNLVFMQFNRDASGKMTPLPKPSIDTGMGLERIVSVLQNVSTNYETDLILPIIRKVEALSERPFGESPKTDVAMKVIADHSRAAAFLVGDGVLPSNEGRGYVLRRILRRAIRYGRNIGLDRPFLHRTSETVFDIMKAAYPELSEASAFITNVIRNEEIRFSETLDHGLALLNETLGGMRGRGERRVPGEVIFKLYDTFGFPVDIVSDVIRDEEMTLDMDGFNAAMEVQRSKSRSVASFTRIGEAYKKLAAEMGDTKPEFVGYPSVEAGGNVLILVKGESEVPEAREGEEIELVTDRTPFYAESGGQVGDTGRITGSGFEMEVLDTVKDPTGLIIHKGKIVSGKIRKGDRVDLAVDSGKRASTARNHTATHILHTVLRKVLGDHVKQAGSLVAPDRLRFDFTHFSPVDPADLERIESLVNERVRQNADVAVEEMDAESALRSGATALFEEKYGDRVRVISLSDFSRELCGGTHTRRTGDIGLFKILHESSVASGVRRIEAVTGEAAVSHVQQNARIVQEASRVLREKPEFLVQRLEKLIAQQKLLERETEKLKSAVAARSAEQEADLVREIEGVPVLIKIVSTENPAALRELADRFRDKLGSGIVVLGSAAQGKALLTVVVTRDLVGRFHAGKIIQAIAPVVGGAAAEDPTWLRRGEPSRKN